MRRICVIEYFCFENVLEVSQVSRGGYAVWKKPSIPSPPLQVQPQRRQALSTLTVRRAQVRSHMSGLVHLKNRDWEWGFHSTVKGLPSLLTIDSGFTPSYVWERWGEGRETETETGTDDCKLRLTFIHAFLVLKSLNIRFINFFT